MKTKIQAIIKSLYEHPEKWERDYFHGEMGVRQDCSEETSIVIRTSKFLWIKMCSLIINKKSIDLTRKEQTILFNTINNMLKYIKQHEQKCLLEKANKELQKNSTNFINNSSDIKENTPTSSNSKNKKLEPELKVNQQEEKIKKLKSKVAKQNTEIMMLRQAMMAYSYDKIGASAQLDSIENTVWHKDG